MYIVGTVNLTEKAESKRGPKDFPFRKLSNSEKALAPRGFMRRALSFVSDKEYAVAPPATSTAPAATSTAPTAAAPAIPRLPLAPTRNTKDGVMTETFVWHDKKMLGFITTAFLGSTQGIQALRRVRGRADRLGVDAAWCMVQYALCFNRVDMVDRMIADFTTSQRSIRWYLRIFFFCLDLVLVAIWIIVSFRMELDESLKQFRHGARKLGGRHRFQLAMADAIIEYAKAGAIKKHGSAQNVPWFPKQQGRPPSDATKEARRRAATEFDPLQHQLMKIKKQKRCRACEDLAKTKYPGASQTERRSIVVKTQTRCAGCPDDVALCAYHHRNGWDHAHGRQVLRGAILDPQKDAAATRSAEDAGISGGHAAKRHATSKKSSKK